MLEQTKSDDRNLSPDEIIRIVQFRYRICKYLNRTGLIWIYAGTIVEIFFVIFVHWFRSRDNAPLVILIEALAMQMIGLAILSIAGAMRIALNRCPVCDSLLFGLHKNTFCCPGCNAQVKSSK